MSIFGRQGRGTLQPIGTANTIAEVSTVDQLKAAIGNAASRNASGGAYAAAGMEIILRQPLKLKAPITIPLACTGLTIRQTGVVPICADGEVSSVFVVNADDVRILNLRVVSSAGHGFASLVSFSPPSGATVIGRITIDGCYFDSSRSTVGAFFSSTSTHTSAVRIIGNLAVGNVAGDTFCQIPGTDYVVSGNVAEGYDAFATTNDAGAGTNVITSNVCGGGPINTSTGTGLNAIDGNVNCGTITNHVTDAVGLNT